MINWKSLFNFIKKKDKKKIKLDCVHMFYRSKLYIILYKQKYFLITSTKDRLQFSKKPSI